MKNVEYYMGLTYEVRVQEYTVKEGGGFRAHIPLLGSGAFHAESDTREKATKKLGHVKEALFAYMIDVGMYIAEPTAVKDVKKYRKIIAKGSEGVFHDWGLDFIEFEESATPFTVGIIEFPDGSCRLLHPDDFVFVDPIKGEKDG